MTSGVTFDRCLQWLTPAEVDRLLQPVAMQIFWPTLGLAVASFAFGYLWRATRS